MRALGKRIVNPRWYKSISVPAEHIHANRNDLKNNPPELVISAALTFKMNELGCINERCAN